jgi:hypothetical protein
VWTQLATRERKAGLSGMAERLATRIKNGCDEFQGENP